MSGSDREAIGMPTLESKPRRKWLRRAKKLGLVLAVPVAGPLVGQVWAEQEAKGWR